MEVQQRHDASNAAQGRSVEAILAEQQLFRSALLELSELAHTTEDDDDFYQRLIERAVEVVPGAQGGSVLLNVPGTTDYRFAAAVGFDLERLQERVLSSEFFFRDAVDPHAQILTDIHNGDAGEEIEEWLASAGQLKDIVVNVSAPVITEGMSVAFLSLDNFEEVSAMTDMSVEMTTVLANLIGQLWRRRAFESELRREREAYRRLAMYDPVTGLANRRHMQDSVRSAVDSSQRYGHPAAAVFVDVDDFKDVNDQHGHDVGDALLRAVGETLHRAVRSSDLVGRWGGDEFLILPGRLDSADQALALAHRMIELFAEPVPLTESIFVLPKVSIGVGWMHADVVQEDDLVRLADEALYDAKADGKGVARLRTEGQD